MTPQFLRLGFCAMLGHVPFGAATLALLEARIGKSSPHSEIFLVCYPEEFLIRCPPLREERSVFSALRNRFLAIVNPLGSHPNLAPREDQKIADRIFDGPSIFDGSGGGIRTRDISVNSRTLYH